MTAKGCLVAFMLFSFSYAYAASGSNSIGTVSVRGNMRVDGNTVQGNGTLFDGTAVETSQATATLRLENGAEIMMATNSRGIVYRDRLVLLQGQSQLRATSSPYFLEADGLRVAPGGPNTVGTVSLEAANTVDVAALAGEFLIYDDMGSPFMHIAPGTAMSFHQTSSPGAPNGTTVTEVGLLSVENGQYYLETIDGTKYLLTGKDLKQYVGDKVVVTGTLEAPMIQSGNPRIDVKSIQINGATGFSKKKGVLWFALAAGGAGLGVAIYEETKPSASP